MATAMLETKSLKVHYGGSYILQEVDFALEGGIGAIIGRNGMGKTTFLKAIMGLAPVTGGSIKFMGTEIVGKKPYEISRLGIGYVPQGRMIFPSLSVDEQMRFVERNQKLFGWNTDKVYELFPRLKERYKQSGTNLSGGEQQMLAIGRALVQNPRLLIMDEPSEGLAPVIVERLVTFINDIVKSGISLILVEQSLPFAAAVAEKVNVMVTGRFAYSGSFDGLLSDRELTNRLLVTG